MFLKTLYSWTSRHWPACRRYRTCRSEACGKSLQARACCLRKSSPRWSRKSQRLTRRSTPWSRTWPPRPPVRSAYPAHIAAIEQIKNDHLIESQHSIVNDIKKQVKLKESETARFKKEVGYGSFRFAAKRMPLENLTEQSKSTRLATTLYSTLKTARKSEPMN